MGVTIRIIDEAGAGEGSFPSAVYGYYVTIVLLLAYTLSFVDRQILGFMVDPVKNDLLLSDAAVSLLQVFAFSLFYATVGAFLGRVADQFNRQRLIMIGMALWCAATVACGFADSYAEFLSPA